MHSSESEYFSCLNLVRFRTRQLHAPLFLFECFGCVIFVVVSSIDFELLMLVICNDQYNLV